MGECLAIFMAIGEKQFNSAKKNLFCGLPAPLLWKGLFYFIPLLTAILFILAAHMIIHMYKNKKQGKNAIDKKLKIVALWFTVVFLSLITYGIVGLDFNYYLLVFFIVMVLVLGAFFLGERFRLFRIHRLAWIAAAIAAVTFAALFAICFVSTVRENAAFANGLQTSCLNRILF